MKEVNGDDLKKQRYWLYIQGNPNIELEKLYKIVQHTRLIAKKLKQRK